MIETDKSMGAVPRRHPALTRVLIHVICIACALSGPLSTGAMAQSTDVDTRAPIIDIDEFEDGIADRRQVFTVLIEEDTELRSATLYHRRSGELPYDPVPMEPLGDTGYYSATIETDMEDLRTIEYYVLAVDTADNRTLSGFAFDPYRRTLKASPTPLAITEASTDASATHPAVTDASPASARSVPLWQRRWFQVTLGLLAAGIVLSAASDDAGEDTRIVPLTFNLQ